MTVEWVAKIAASGQPRKVGGAQPIAVATVEGKGQKKELSHVD